MSNNVVQFPTPKTETTVRAFISEPGFECKLFAYLNGEAWLKNIKIINVDTEKTASGTVTLVDLSGNVDRIRELLDKVQYMADKVHEIKKESKVKRIKKHLKAIFNIIGSFFSE
jgi:hypothetical protein